MPCRSELARDELKDTAFIQKTRVIVNVHREQSSVDRLLLQTPTDIPPSNEIPAARESTHKHCAARGSSRSPHAPEPDWHHCRQSCPGDGG